MTRDGSHGAFLAHPQRDVNPHPSRNGPCHHTELHSSVGLALPVRIELLAGARTADVVALRRALSGLPVFAPTVATWVRVEDWVARARARGARFGALDLLIGGIATENDASVWSLDSDFARMASLGFVRLHAPRRH